MFQFALKPVKLHSRPNSGPSCHQNPKTRIMSEQLYPIFRFNAAVTCTKNNKNSTTNSLENLKLISGPCLHENPLQDCSP